MKVYPGENQSDADRESVEEKRQKDKKPGKAKKVILTIAIILAVLCAACAGGGLAVQNSAEIFPKATIAGITVGGMTKDQAANVLEENDWDNSNDNNIVVELPAGCEINVNVRQATGVSTASDAAEAAFRYGRDCNAFSAMIKYLGCLIREKDLSSYATNIDEGYIRGLINDAVSEADELMSGDSYSIDIDNQTLTIVKGYVEVNTDSIYRTIVEAIGKGEYGQIDYDYDYDDVNDIDFNVLHDKVYAEPVDASYDSEKGEVTESVVGIDFDVDNAEKLWKEAKAGDLVRIPLVITEPKFTTDSLSDKLFADKLGEQTTTFKSSSANRINNIAQAAKKIDGVVLNPGEKFSYNETVGQRTEAAGFMKAGAYANGQVVQELGGGICQVSSTLYCAVLYANLKIADRTCHYFPVDYVPAGLDATVSWKSPDFVFENNREYPIKISAECDSVNKSITIQIWGTDVDGSYVELKSSTWKYYDSKYPTVALGYKATTYRNVYDKDGSLIESKTEASSTYHYHTENIVYPSPSPSPSPTVSEEPTPTPTPTPAIDPEITPTPEITQPVETDSQETIGE